MIKRILYAEDNLNDIELTLSAIRESDFTNPVDVVHNGEETLDYLFYRNKYADRTKSVPAFLLLDIKMPKVNGIEVLKAVRESEEYKNLPVVMLTSSGIESDIAKSYDLGANGFVVKPVDFNDFVKAIKGIGYFWAVLNIFPHNL